MYSEIYGSEIFMKTRIKNKEKGQESPFSLLQTNQFKTNQAVKSLADPI